MSEAEDATSEARIGRPGVGLTLNPQGALFVGLNIETTSITAVLLDLSMASLITIVEPLAPDERAFEPLSERLISLGRRTILKAGRSSRRIKGVGVAVPGLVDREGRIRNAPLLEWRDVDLQSRLKSGLDTPAEVRICNDAVALACAVCATATEAEKGEFLLVLMSEGIGSALVRDGKVIEGANGYAGEIGQLTMAATCEGGTRDTFQMLAGHRFFLPFLDPRQSVVETLARLAEQGSNLPGFDAALDLWAERLTAGLLNAIRLLDPERIVLGGPLSRLFPRVGERVRASLHGQLLGMQAPSIAVSPFGAEGAAVGAAAMIRESLFDLPGIVDG